jgi:hypothetical protein
VGVAGWELVTPLLITVFIDLNPHALAEWFQDLLLATGRLGSCHHLA